jgi:CBS domain-containing protein
MIVEALMSREPKTCTTADTLHRAAQLMWDHDFGSVPVVDAAGKLAGIVTDRDVCMSSFTRGQPLHEIPVSDAMSKSVFTISPKATLESAATLFRERQVRRAPVVDANGALVGVLSISDLVCASGDGKIQKHVKPEAVLAAVHAVSKPRPVAAAAAKHEAGAKSPASITPQPRGQPSATASAQKSPVAPKTAQAPAAKAGKGSKKR